MSDLIRRQDAIDAVDRFRNIDGISVWHNGIKESIRIAIIEDLAKLPSADRQDDNRLYIKIYADDESSRKAEKLYQICGETENQEVTQWLKDYFPSADRPTGEWVEEDEYGDLFVCSECGFANDYKDNYCPNCGAKMGGEEE